MYCKCTLRLTHHTYLNLSEFRAAVPLVQRWLRLVQEIRPQGESASLRCVNYNDTGVKQEMDPILLLLKEALASGMRLYAQRHVYAGTLPRWISASPQTRVSPSHSEIIVSHADSKSITEARCLVLEQTLFIMEDPNCNVWNQILLLLHYKSHWMQWICFIQVHSGLTGREVWIFFHPHKQWGLVRDLFLMFMDFSLVHTAYGKLFFSNKQ